MTAGKIYTDKIGNPQLSLTLAERDGEQLLIKLRKFLKCSNQIVLTHTKANGKVWNHFTLRFSSKRIAERLIEIGERFTAKVVGLEDNKHFGTVFETVKTLSHY